MHRSSYEVNPRYAQRIRRPNTTTATLPAIPQNGSPVPHLTSLYHFSDPGAYGDRSYPGNCGGNLIRDLLMYFKPSSVLDPMMGGGTCRDVCRELRIPCHSTDLKTGVDACSPAGYPAQRKFDFVWAHPPYFRMKEYSSNKRCMSQAGALGTFLDQYQQFMANIRSVTAENGVFAVLMGDYLDRKGGYMPLVYHTKRLAFNAGFRQQCTDIIRFSHGATSGRKSYRSSFIPQLHDVCMLFSPSSDDC